MTTLRLETTHGPAHVHIQRERAARSPRPRPRRGRRRRGERTSSPRGTWRSSRAGSPSRSSSSPTASPAARSPPPRRAPRCGSLESSRRSVAAVPRVAARSSEGARRGRVSPAARPTCDGRGRRSSVSHLPLQPPQGERPEPRPSRLAELEGRQVELLVVQGDRDRFGIPPAAGRRKVCRRDGDHSLRQGLDTAAPLVGEWLQRVTEERTVDERHRSGQVHAYRVGEIEIIVVADGERTAPVAEGFVLNAPIDEVKRGLRRPRHPGRSRQHAVQPDGDQDRGQDRARRHGRAVRTRPRSRARPPAS